MGDLIVGLSGTPDGQRLALALLLVSALAHATFGAINKGGIDPFINRGAINLTYSLMAAPFALFVFDWPTEAVWWALAVAFVVHIVYEYLLASAFQSGEFTLVYPIARGTGPIAGLILAVAIFQESYSIGQWIGALVLSAAIVGLAITNINTVGTDRVGLGRLRFAIAMALATGVMVAVYTVVDAYGIRLAADPFTFLAWFFTLSGLGFPVIALVRWQFVPIKPKLSGLAVRAVAGALIAFISFGSIMIATRLDSVGKAAALRETSIIFATLIGVLIFRERIDGVRVLLIVLITCGAVLVEIG